MTDFDTRILDEDAEAAIPADLTAEDVDRRCRPTPVPASMRPGPGNEQPERRGHVPEHTEEHAEKGSPAATSQADPEPTGEPARRRLLGTAVVALARAPERMDLRPVAAVYEAASAHETSTAADALLCTYLRSATETRRRARPVLAEQLAQTRGSPLARALADRLGAVAMPAAAPHSVPPVPPPGPPEEHEHRPEGGEA